MKYIKKTDFVRWFLTIVFVLLIFKDAGFLVGLFATLVSVEIELSTLYRRIDSEWKKAVMEAIKEMGGV